MTHDMWIAAVFMAGIALLFVLAALVVDAAASRSPKGRKAAVLAKAEIEGKPLAFGEPGPRKDQWRKRIERREKKILQLQERMKNEKGEVRDILRAKIKEIEAQAERERVVIGDL